MAVFRAARPRVSADSSLSGGLMSTLIRALVAAAAIAAIGSGATASTVGLTDLGTCNIGQLTTSTACAGAFDGNDANSNLDGLFGQAGWTEIAKIEDGTADGILTITNAGGTSGTWSVTGWGGLSKVMAVLKGGPDFAAYLLDLSKTGGTWNTLGLLKGNGRPGPGLSHFTLYGVPSEVPLPAAGWLMLAGLGGLGFAGRKKAA